MGLEDEVSRVRRLRRVVARVRILDGRVMPTGHITAKLWEMAQEEPGGAVVLGNSVPQSAFDPRHLSTRLFNACLDRAQPDALWAWCHEAVVPMLRPRHLILAYVGFEFNANSRSRKRREPEFGDVRQLALLLRAGLFRIGLDWVSTRETRRLVARMWPAPQRRYWQGWNDKWADRSDWTSPAMEEVIHGFFHDYRLAGDLFEDHRSLLHLARQLGMATTLIRMPMRPKVVERFPLGRDDLEEVWQRLGAEHPIVEMPELDDDCYADELHLNGRGTKQATAWLDALLIDR